MASRRFAQPRRRLKEISEETKKERLIIEEKKITEAIEAVSISEKIKPFKYGTEAYIDSIDASILTRTHILSIPYLKISKRFEVSSTGVGNVSPSLLQNTIYDHRLGPSSYNDKCSTCGEDKTCPGHLGYIDLGVNPEEPDYIEPFLNPAAGVIIKSILNIICSCGSLPFTKYQIDMWKLGNKSFVKRVRVIEDLIKSMRKKGSIKCVGRKIKRLNLETGEEEVLDSITECSKLKWPILYNSKLNAIVTADNPQIPIETRLVSEILSRIRPEDENMLGFTNYHAVDLLMTFVIVLPPRMRETVMVGFDGRKTDFFGQRYDNILKNKMTINPNKGRGTVKGKPQKRLNSIEVHKIIMQIFSSPETKKAIKIPGIQDMKGVKEIIKGKDGLIRENMTGRRLNHTIRAVIVDGNYLKLTEMGIPKVICDRMLVKLYIIRRFLPILTEMLKDNKLIMYAPRSGHYERTTFNIKNYIKRKNFKLILGDAVYRPLYNGDIIVLGRNPTIHKNSIMSFVVNVISGNVIACHDALSTPFNEDHDGDEFHGVVPQELRSQAEARYVSIANRCIMNTENSRVTMGLVQDAITAFFIMTIMTDFGYYEFTELEMNTIKKLFTWKQDMEFFEKRLKKYRISKSSTRGIISMLFPYNFNYNKDGKDKSKVIIIDGVFVSGTLSNQEIGPSGTFIDRLYKEYGQNQAAYFITDGTRLGNHWITFMRGFTVGISSTQMNNEYVKQIKDTAIVRIRQYLNTIDPTGQTEAEEQLKENEIVNILQNKIQSLGIKLTRQVLAGINEFKAMIISGAKGDIFHASQMIALLAQQFLLGDRLQRDMGGGERGDPYTQPNDPDISARGFISHSLGEGLSVRDEIAHHKAGRGNLIDTSTKTAEVGEDHHLKNKALLDFVVAYDGSLRDTNGMIVQFCANYNGLDPHHITTVNYRGRQVPYFMDPIAIVNKVNSEMRWKQ